MVGDVSPAHGCPEGGLSPGAGRGQPASPPPGPGLGAEACIPHAQPLQPPGAGGGHLQGIHSVFPWLGFFLSPNSCPQCGFWREPPPPEDTGVDRPGRSRLLAPRFRGSRADIRRAGVPAVRWHRRDLTAVVRRGWLTWRGVWVLWLGWASEAIYPRFRAPRERSRSGLKENKSELLKTRLFMDRLSCMHLTALRIEYN